MVSEIKNLVIVHTNYQFVCVLLSILTGKDFMDGEIFFLLLPVKRQCHFSVQQELNFSIRYLGRGQKP